jgi:hypothetical protein
LITTGPWWLPAVASRPTPTPAAHAGHRVHNRDLPRQLEQPQAPAGQADGAALVGSRHERAARQFRRANGDLHLAARRAAAGRSRREDRHIRRAPLRQRGGRVEVIGAVTEVPPKLGTSSKLSPGSSDQASNRALARARATDSRIWAPTGATVVAVPPDPNDGHTFGVRIVRSRSNDE